MSKATELDDETENLHLRIYEYERSNEFDKAMGLINADRSKIDPTYGDGQFFHIAIFKNNLPMLKLLFELMKEKHIDMTRALIKEFKDAEENYLLTPEMEQELNEFDPNILKEEDEQHLSDFDELDPGELDNETASSSGSSVPLATSSSGSSISIVPLTDEALALHDAHYREPSPAPNKQTAATQPFIPNIHNISVDTTGTTSDENDSNH